MGPNVARYLPWFILREIPHVGNQHYNRLLQAFGSPEQVLAAGHDTLAAIPGISQKTITGIKNQNRYMDAARMELNQIQDLGIGVATIQDTAFPQLLKTIPDPPPILTYKGVLYPEVPCIAIVGSRAASSYGKGAARHLACSLADKGFCIVSGMARGIDTAAHLGALDSSGKTIAVLGSGLKKIYPRENRALFNKIQKHGAVISEFKLDTDPYPYNFPVRNRVIAGLSCGTIVVEAARKSGSLITARLAAEYNREVFAVPGSIRSQKSRGTHFLLKQGAKLVENVTDVVEELSQFIHASIQNTGSGDEQLQTKTSPIPVLDNSKNKIMQVLDAYPRHIDQIIEATRMDSESVSAILLELELAGVVKHHPGNYFSIL
ncbi:MAG: DNA-processing protein DprA [Desulfotignum sp.]|nr:DNA-processing protein DprA [Desulfotignum sp.]MCF8124758.1 DNA-processing protein DprA [Desulfotignum sp.]